MFLSFPLNAWLSRGSKDAFTDSLPRSVQELCLINGLLATVVREEHWTGLGLDWIRTMINFVDLGLDRNCICFINLESAPDLD